MKLTAEEKIKASEALIKEWASEQFIKSDMDLDQTTELINGEFDRRYTPNAVHSWCIEGFWDEKRMAYKKKRKSMPIQANAKQLKEDLDKKDYDRVDELIGMLEDVYEAKPNAKDLNAILGGYKLKRELRASVIVGEDTDEISKVLAKYNQVNIQINNNISKDEDIKPVDFSKDLVDVIANNKS